MTLVRPISRTTALGVALAVAAAAMAIAAASAPPKQVKATPFVTGHIEGQALTFPPDTNYCVTNFGIHCYRPAQFQAAYDLAPLYAHGFDGRGRTIVIVDSFGSPTIRQDLQVFDETFGLPAPPAFNIIAPVGPIPAFDPNNGDHVGWAQETTLDVEWSHTMAPGANILLVETPVAETEGVTGFPEIVAAENYVINHNLGDVITQSFGATENTFPSRSSLLALRSAFMNARAHHVTVLASSGDTGSTNFQLNLSDLYTMPVNSWPSSDPLVTSVGGTQLLLDLAGQRLAPDVVWNDGFGAGGGGKSQVFERPDFQDRVEKVTGDARGTPDISLSAAVDGGVIVYYSFIRPTSPWHIFGGTSEASPLLSGVVAIADQIAGHRLGAINGRLYRMAHNATANGIVDVTSGNNDLGPFTNSDGITYHVPGYSAGPGYDLATGLGTVDAALFAPALAHSPGDD